MLTYITCLELLQSKLKFQSHSVTLAVLLGPRIAWHKPFKNDYPSDSPKVVKDTRLSVPYLRVCYHLLLFIHVSPVVLMSGIS